MTWLICRMKNMLHLQKRRVEWQDRGMEREKRNINQGLYISIR
jgi:hypothetical protein